jgi:hypothetical protein
MKKITLFVCALSIGTLTIAQTICPTSFKRDNGNGQCPSGRFTLNFNTCPEPALTIDSIYRGGVKQDVSIGEYSCSNGRASYCFIGGNLAPAGSLLVYFSRAGIPGSTFGCYVPESGPLPVKISSMSAKRSGSSVLITWKTEVEINAKEYIIQRKTNKDFIDIGIVPASNRTEGNSYSFTDMNTEKGISEYRLKMVDLDGSFKNSDIKIVKGTTTLTDFIVYPNPSTGNAKIVLTDVSEVFDVQVITPFGQVIKTQNMEKQNTIELNNLKSGMYMIRIVNNKTGETTSKKLSVVNQ